MILDKVMFTNAASLFDHLRDSFGYQLEAPVDVDAIAQLLGVQVVSDDSLESRDVVGEIFFNEGNPVVRINPVQNSYEPRRRFTLAHELGHYCLHSASSKAGFKDSRKSMSRTESYWDRYESEANTFAAQLLMPKSLVLSVGQEVIDGYKQRYGVESISASSFIELMADKFAVSSKAMEYRLKNIGVIKTV